MTLSPARGADGRRRSILAFDLSTLVTWVAISLLVVETFSGALRYYLDLAGLGPLLYLPKAACVLMFGLALLRLRAGPLFWLCLLGWLLSALLGMLHGASLQNLAFSLFAISPLLFGLVHSQMLLARRRLLGWSIALCLLASLAGLLLDKYGQVPWKGYSYNLGSTELSGNTAWSADDQDRVAGFARVSNILSNLIAFYSLFLLLFIRSLLLRLLLCAAALVAIVLTTSKAPAGAFALTLGLLLILRLAWTCRALFVLAVGMGLLLPALGLLQDFDAHTVSQGGSSLASLYDRLNNTWPNLFNAMSREGWGYTGAGFGMVGSTMALFPVPGAGVLLGMDNSALYLWAMFGAAGLLLYSLQVPMFCSLLDDRSRVGHMLLSIGFCWCLIGWTTDMFEIAGANLFIGLVIGYAVSDRLLEQTAPSSAAAPHPLPYEALR
ncbi:hypothetical protein RRX38_15940 [Pseudomonas sp. DTU_2021_1001937_2_SI_NGA_ILE_001]|uniref:hypothetical protein n=1 Tax=Pseudomonas sp. DTU_2021_1001937_2_SI_NGA_ILE_001 TaxID=3077589 RepID=UPI0028FC19B0|nr:hypothetical protein [Pseudomonas sp. DTU_2021_1001937_2_SI_NGA_ILE_001]WNW12570.1 hypothetical protein RRX38_15940 [Pseudomonas sp. DTU_2021_1001937_2_SI_NGA_ILE_001]